jgi:hypothetical protein
MNIPAAIDRIETALINLGTSVGEPVFDEWALVAKDAMGWKLIEYGGTRKNDFLAQFNSDIAALRGTLEPSSACVGDFAFSHEGYGSGFDAHICAGESIFVLLNNTAKSTGEITDNPKWTSAQIYFSELMEAFIADPVS